MNSNLKNFIQEEISKLYKLTLLKEQKQQIERELNLLNEDKKILPKKNSAEWHQLQVAKKTMEMTDDGANIMGGMTKGEAKKVLSKYNIKY